MSKLFELIQRIQNHQDTLNSGNEEAPEEQQRNLTADGESATQQVLGRIFSVPSDSTRVVMLLNDADLKDRYLTGKGEKKIVDAATDEQISSIFSHAQFQVDGEVDPNAAFVFDVVDFDLTSIDKQTSDKRPYAVLLNVPKSTAAKLSSQAPTDIEDARKILVEIISHKNYVATLNAAAIKKAGVGALDDRDEREEQFNVKKFVTAYPVRSVIDAARAEQDEKDSHTRVTPADAEQSVPKQKAALTPAELAMAKTIAADARRIYFANSAKDKWPTTPEGLEELRNKLVNALTKDSRIGENKRLIPAIVKSFYTSQVKIDRHYRDLLALLKADANFMALASGAEPEETSTAAPADEVADDEVADDEASVQAEPAAEKTAAELAAEIKSRGDDYAGEVAKILSGRAASPTPTEGTPSDLPDDVKAEVERLKKIQKNAINPKQREKAAADLATLLHREEEKKKPKKKK